MSQQDIIAWIVHDAVLFGIHVDPTSINYALYDTTLRVQVTIVNTRPGDIEASLMISALYVIVLDVFVASVCMCENMAQNVALERMSPRVTVDIRWRQPVPWIAPF